MRFALMTGVQTCALPICLGNHGFWLRRFCRRDAYQFQSTEGEHDDRQRQQHAAEAVGEEATVRPQVADACLLAPLATDQQEKPEQDHADNGGDLDDGKPELGLTEGLDVAEIDQIDQHEERSGCGPGGNIRPPELYVLADRRQLGHAHQDVQHPVVPAGKEPRITAAIFVRSEEHTSELQSLMRNSYAVFCLKKKKKI